MDPAPFPRHARPRQFLLPTAAAVIACAATPFATNNGLTTAGTPRSYIGMSPPGTRVKPTIAGIPSGHVTAGSSYEFQPAVRGTLGQPWSFSVKNKPAWASFSIATGRLYGTPTNAQAGTYANVEISVSNGRRAAALPAFNITVDDGVNSKSTGSATISWLVPTDDASGSAPTDLAGLRIYYGTSASDLRNMIELASPYESSYTISDLAAGIWYFAVTTYTMAGTQSALSSVVSKSIP